ncbi:MAG: hypothetical protein KC502_22965, partial [Myxococcales bacterium]|nr:hypothetical protein [Myxococcales bacterium]
MKPTPTSVYSRAFAPLMMVALLLSACGSDDPNGSQATGAACGLTSDCPTDFVCGEGGFCVAKGAGGTIDGGMADDGGSGGADVSFGSPDTLVDGGGTASDAGDDDTSTGATSCSGRCGAVTGGCACNSNCAAAGNCCDDYESECGGGNTGCNNDNECNDNDPCTDNACISGECKTSKKANCCASASDCDDGLACTTDACNSGSCAHTPSGNACLIEGKCVSSGTKGPGICLVCSPSAKATAWSIDLGGSCDDGKPCTNNDACTAGGSCAGTADPGCCASDAECTSTLPCQVGACDQTTKKCKFSPKVGCCKSDSDCTGQAQPCKVLFCNQTVGACDVKTASDGATCDDGNGCTVSDACTTGLCVGKANTCDDNNPCTTDACQAGKCSHTEVPGCGACWDATAKKPRPKGTSCGKDTLAKEQRCGTNLIEERIAVAGCTGKDTVCSKATDNYAWGAWKTAQTCTKGQKCEEKVKGQPACVSTTLPLADLVPVSFAPTKKSYAPGEKVTVGGVMSNKGTGTAGLTTARYYLSKDSKLTGIDAILASVTKGGLAAGQSTSLTTAFNLPKSGTAGTWYLIVKVDALNKVKESNELNNTRVYPITIGSITTGADLTPTSFSTSKTVYAPGNTITAYGAVKNIGKGKSGSYTLEWRLSTNSAITTGDKLLKTLTRTALNPNTTTSASTSLVLPATTAVGTYYIGLWVNRSKLSGETNYSNNIRTYKITVTKSAKADLIPLGFKSSKTSYAPGSAVTVYGSVKNQGNANAGKFTLEWRLSTNNIISSGDKLLKVLGKTSLSAGSSTSALTSFTLPATTAPGTYYLGLWADRTNQVSEITTSNNIAMYKITVAPAVKMPDLVPVAFKSSKTTYTAGSSVVVYGSVKNQGTATAGSQRLEWRLSTNTVMSSGDKLMKTLNKSTLLAGASTSALTSFVLPATTLPGIYYLGLKVDALNQVKESSETNNIAWYKITVTKPGTTADLRPVSFKSTKTTYAAGSLVSVSGLVRNYGTAPAGAFSVEWRLSTNTTMSTGDKLMKTLTRTGLAAGSSTSAYTSFTLPATTTPGTYYLGIWIDRTNQVKESSTTNNIAWYKITVTKPLNTPDLIPVAFKSTKTVYAPGSSVVVTGSVKNQGSGASGT